MTDPIIYDDGIQQITASDAQRSARPRHIVAPREFRRAMWRAECGCGWTGERRSTFIAAEDDAKAHDREVNGDV